MRVLLQIIEHLQGEGLLDGEQLAYLRSQGFLPFEDRQEATGEGDAFDDPYDDLEESALQRQRVPGRGHRPRGAGLNQLRRALGAQIEGWHEPLEGMILLARQLSGDTKANVRTAPARLAAIDDASLRQAVAQAISSRSPSLRTLFRALAFDAFERPCTSRVSARAQRAYDAFLDAPRRREAPPNAHLLRHASFRWAAQVVNAQARLCEAVRAVIDNDFALIDREMGRELQPDAFWPLAILYSARRFAQGKGDEPKPGERRVRSPLPDEDLWHQAWSLAVSLDPASVTPFFVWHLRHTALEVVAVFDSGEVLLYRLGESQPVRRYQAVGTLAHWGGVPGMAFFPDGDRFVTVGGDGYIRVWDVESELPLQAFPARKRSTDDLWDVAVSPDGTQVAVCSNDNGQIRLFDVQTGQSIRHYSGHSEHTWSLDFSPDGHWLVSGGEDGKIRLWSLISQAHTAAHVLSAGTSVTSVRFTGDGRFVLASHRNYYDSEVQLWDLSQLRRVVQAEASRQTFQEVTPLPDGETYFASGDRGPELYQLGKPEPLRRYEGHRGTTYTILPARAGRWVVTAGHDGTVRVWETQTGRLVQCFEGSGPTTGALPRPGSDAPRLVCPERWEKIYG